MLSEFSPEMGTLIWAGSHHSPQLTLPAPLSQKLLRLLSSVGILPQPDLKSQSRDREASVMGLLVSGYTGKVRRKLVFPWICARSWDVPQVSGHPQVSRAASAFQSISLGQKISPSALCLNQILCHSDKTCPSRIYYLGKALCSPGLGISLQKRNSSPM